VLSLRGFLNPFQEVIKIYFFCIFMYADDVIGEVRRMHKEALLSPLKIIQNKQIIFTPPFIFPSEVLHKVH